MCSKLLCALKAKSKQEQEQASVACDNEQVNCFTLWVHMKNGSGKKWWEDLKRKRKKEGDWIRKIKISIAEFWAVREVSSALFWPTLDKGEPLTALGSQQRIIIIIMYIYLALISALSTHMIHINLNMIFYMHVTHSPTKTIYIKWYQKTCTHTHNSMNSNMYDTVCASMCVCMHTHTHWQ